MSVFFFKDTATSEIYTLSLHDALPIWADCMPGSRGLGAPPSWRPVRRLPAGTVLPRAAGRMPADRPAGSRRSRSEEHTSELQSRLHLVCRLLLEKKKITLVTAVRHPTA